MSILDFENNMEKYEGKEFKNKIKNDDDDTDILENKTLDYKNINILENIDSNNIANYSIEKSL